MLLPELVAHRGFAKTHPENTLCGLEAAIDAGARHLEVDVQLSADGYPVLFHDRSLERMCAKSGAIHEHTLAQLRELSASEQRRFGDQFATEGLASLAGFVQLLTHHPHVHAFVEIKRVAIEVFGGERILEHVLSAIEPALHQCTLISFSLIFLSNVRNRHAIPIGAVFDRWEERLQPAARDIEPDFVFCDVDGLPRSGELHGGRARVVVYEVAEPSLAIELRSRGVDMVETFDIGGMLRAFGELRER